MTKFAAIYCIIAVLSGNASLSERHRQILADTRDNTNRIDGAGLDLLLKLAATLPVGKDVFQIAETVGAENLLNHPDTFRGQLIQLRLRCYTTSRARPGSLAMPFYHAFCKEHPTGKPVQVVLVEDPGDGPWPQDARIAGYFYKIRKYPPRGKGPGAPKFVRAPVIVAKRLEQSTFAPPPSGSGATLKYGFLMALLLLLLAGWFFLRLRIGKRSKAALPHRDTPPSDDDYIPPTDDPAEALNILKSKR